MHGKKNFWGYSLYYFFVQSFLLFIKFKFYFFESFNLQVLQKQAGKAQQYVCMQNRQKHYV